MNKLLGGIILAIFGLVITVVAVVTGAGIAAGVVGGLFLGAGILWIADEIIKRKP